MTISTQSSKNTTNQNSALNPIKTQLTLYPFVKLTSAFIVILSALIFCSCEVTYPAKTLPTQLKKIVKEEYNLDIVSRISGKTLWAYLPLPNLLEDKKSVWNTTELEKTGKVLSTMQRVTLSTDAKIDFIALATADTRQFGIELISIEYIPDIKEAMLERFSRGEFILRNVRDINVNPRAIGDTKGASQTFRDISFEEFLSLQIINRVKMLFIKDPQLLKFFELKSTGWKTRFSTLNLEFEFIRKKYDMDLKEQTIDPLNFVKMTTAQVLRNYNTKKIQAVSLTDTFTQKTVKLTQAELKKIKIRLPNIID